MVIEREDERRLRPKRDISEPQLLGDGRRPHEESIGHNASDRWFVPVGQQSPSKCLDMLRHVVQERAHELVMVKRPVEADGQSVADGLIPDVDAGCSCIGKDVAVGRRFVGR